MPHEDPCWGRAEEVGRGSSPVPLFCTTSLAQARVAGGDGLFEPDAGRRALPEHCLLLEAALVLCRDLSNSAESGGIAGVKDGDDLGSFLLHYSALSLPLSHRRYHSQARRKTRGEHLTHKRSPLCVADLASVGTVATEVKNFADQDRVTRGAAGQGSGARNHLPSAAGYQDRASHQDDAQLITSLMPTPSSVRVTGIRRMSSAE